MRSLPRLRALLRTSLFTYETPKLVIIESKCVGILNKFIQLLLFIAVIIYIFIINNGYQHIDNGAIGGFTTKIKGVGYSNSTDDRVGRRIWDAADLHIPPQDSAAFFSPTNFIITSYQTLSDCTNTNEWHTSCTTDGDCKKEGEPYRFANGISTGRCNTTVGHCILHAWCPPEDDSLPEDGKVAVLHNAKDFTVLIKNHVYFPYYEKGRSNLIELITRESLHGCLYHPIDSQFCPIFRLGTIVGMAGRKSSVPDEQKDDEYFRKMAVHGGVISITVKWDCNFDYAESDCKPRYQFKRLDDLHEDVISKGYNFRFSVPFREEGVHKRHLVKAFGILFLLITEAVGRAFDMTTFMLNVGSGLGLLGIASIVCNILLFHLHSNRAYYRRFQSEPVVKVASRKNRVNEQEVAAMFKLSNGSNDSADIEEKPLP